MSGEYVGKLKRRALKFLEEAERVDDPDLAAFFSEQAMQLYVKAVIYELFGERVRGHGIRELLGLLVKLLREAGYSGESLLLEEFADRMREYLIKAEDAYIDARYGEGFSWEVSVKLVEVARRLVNLLDEVSARVKMG